MDTVTKYIELIEKSDENASQNKSKITQDIIDMEGMSGTKTRHFYNNLLHFEDCRYLEIGTWKGSTTKSDTWWNGIYIGILQK